MRGFWQRFGDFLSSLFRRTEEVAEEVEELSDKVSEALTHRVPVEIDGVLKDQVEIAVKPLDKEVTVSLGADLEPGWLCQLLPGLGACRQKAAENAEKEGRGV